MNDPQKTYLAESKPYQLHLADECGLRVPASIISNDFHQMQNFFQADLIVKSLDSVLIRENKDCLFTYSIVTNSSKLNDSNTCQVPLIAQELLHPKEDLRVTIIGKDIYAVKILKEGIGIEGDWRRTPKESLEYIDAELPSELIENLLLFVDRMGLSFAAIDLAKTEGGYYFIEVNPTGEWGWLQSKNRDIAASLARWLVSPK